jgi:hypothetical protein
MLAESLANFREGRRARFHNLTSNDIRIDDWHAQLREHIGYR